MINSLFLLSPSGTVLIERNFRQPTPSPSRLPADYFWNLCQKSDPSYFATATSNTGIEDEEGSSGGFGSIPPVLALPNSNLLLVSVYRGSLIFLCTVSRECPPLYIIEFLHRIADTFVIYFTTLDEDSIKENFSTVYQLLEEMIDNGYPLTTEPNSLTSLIPPPTLYSKLQKIATGNSQGVSETLSEGIVSNMPWRKSNVKYQQNEIYVDLVEEIDAILSPTGSVISSDVSGSIQCNSKLSGLPDLTLTFRDPTVIDDCSFHPCVRYSRFDRERVISFVPPDGAFELMRYRVKNVSKILSMPIYVNPLITYGNKTNDNNSFDKSSTFQSSSSSLGLSGNINPSSASRVDGRISITIGLTPTSSLIYPPSKGDMTVEDIILTIPFDKLVRTANLKVSFGTVVYDEGTKIAVWTIPKLTNTMKVQLSGTMLLSSSQYNNSQSHNINESTTTLTLNWKVPMASVSGLSVSGLSLGNEGYRPYKGVRSLCKSGRVSVRCG